MGTEPIDCAKTYFRMPNPVKVTGRTSSITNSFINSIIPVVRPTSAEVKTALEILGMLEGAECAYCGGEFTEWDHLRPLVEKKMPTGQISEIHNLVPACGKCNQFKGNKHWHAWMFGPAKLSPKSRGILDLDDRALRLTAYENWLPREPLNFESLVGGDVWARHWDYRAQIEALMKEAQINADAIRKTVLVAFLDARQEQPG